MPMETDSEPTDKSLILAAASDILALNSIDFDCSIVDGNRETVGMSISGFALAVVF